MKYEENGSGEERMKTAKGVGLLAGVLALIHGLYPILYVMWEFGLATFAPQRLAFVIIDTVVYLVLSIGVILDKRRVFFLLTVFWTMVGSALAVVSPYSPAVYIHLPFFYFYKVAAVNPTLNLLSFLMVFFSTYYYVTKTNAVTSRYMEFSAGILALAQGVYLLSEIVPLPPWVWLHPGLYHLEARMVIYLVLGYRIVKGNRKFLSYTVLWTILESAVSLVLTIATYRFYFLENELLNLLSILTLFLSTYCYWAKPET